MTGVTFHKCSSLEGKSKKNFFLLMTEFNFFFFFFFLRKGQRERKGANDGELMRFYLIHSFRHSVLAEGRWLDPIYLF